MGLLRTKLEKVKEEKEGFEFKIAKFEKSAKDLDELLASQITDKTKKGFGYNVVPSPHPLILITKHRPLDLSYSGLEEFKEPEVKEYGPRDSSLKPTTSCDKEERRTKKARENMNAPIIEDWVSGDEDEVDQSLSFEKENCIMTLLLLRKRLLNLKNLLGGQLGMQRCTGHKDLEEIKEIGMVRSPINLEVILLKTMVENTRRVNDYYSTRMTHSNPRRNMIPQAVLMRSGLKPVNTAKPKDAHNVVKRNWFYDVKASACWVWRPKQKEILDNVSKHNCASMILKKGRED
ncbi:hypothetical protein Tco_0792781 [Tanacetum coccineum]